MHITAIAEAIVQNDRLGKPREALRLIQGLALALSDAGRGEEAISAYHKALERATEINDAALLAQVRRNFGLFLSELNRDHEAETELIGAVEEAKKSASIEMLARSQIALGIFYQHRSRNSEASPLLAEALQSIDPAHPDAVVGQMHLQALQSGKTCGCDNQTEGLAAAFREFALRRLRSDLLDDLDVTAHDNDFKIGLRLHRQPSEEEMGHLNRVISEVCWSSELMGERPRSGICRKNDGKSVAAAIGAQWERGRMRVFEKMLQSARVRVTRGKWRRPAA